MTYAAPSDITSSTTTGTAAPAKPLSQRASGGDHIAISMPDDSPSTLAPSKTSTVKIPVQTGPIYFLCSLSDVAPSQPVSAAKKGKGVVPPPSSSTAASSSGSRRATGSRTARRPPSSIPTSSVGAGTAASSSLALPRRTSSGQGSGSTDAAAAGSQAQDLVEEVEDEEEDGESAERHEELSPVMAPQATGFDRLREAGFSEDEIRSIRRQFHASRGTLAASVGENGIAADDEDATARARRIEEEWIDQHGAETLPEGRK